jgi:aryl-alcohol dehydrogenase-like predicted oxidoreductase
VVDYRPFGRTGVRVSPLTLGAMNFGQRGNPDHEDSIRIIHRALDDGINVVDTADVYSQGESEEIVGKALDAGRRDDVFLSTKFHGQIGENVNHFGNSRRWIFQEVEQSLRRLRTDWIDLYQVHRPEPDTDFDDTLGALSDLVHQGKIRYIGTSTFPASAIVQGQWIAQRRGRERVVSEQPPYSILARGIEREVLPVAQRYGLAVIPWSPLAGGWLSGRYHRGLTAPALKNPTYAGAYTFGKTRDVRRVQPDGSVRSARRKQAREDWTVVIEDHHEGYLTWSDYLTIEANLAANNTQKHARPVREGTALCQGIIFCGVCGGRVGTRYDRRDRKVTYSCQVKDSARTPQCRNFSATAVDDAVAALFPDTITPEQIGWPSQPLRRSPSGTPAATAPPNWRCNRPATRPTAPNGHSATWSRKTVWWQGLWSRGGRPDSPR